MKKTLIYYLLIVLAPFTELYESSAQSRMNASDLKHWGKNSSPMEIGKKLTERFIATAHPKNKRPDRPDIITYPEVCTWYGALTYAKVSKNNSLLSDLFKRFEPLLGVNSNLVPIPHHVDNSVFGSLPLELYILSKEKKYLDLGRYIADSQWNLPDNEKNNPESKILYDKGLTWQTRMWIDDMYMITLVQVQAYRATGDVKYINRAANEMAIYLDSLQQANGLFYHALDVPFFWGRGNGWVAAGMTEMLLSLPENNPQRVRILKSYKIMMSSLLKYQTSKGMWRQIIDDPESWPETSGTGMFTFAMITGVKNGWLDKKVYGATARKAWMGLISYIDENGDIEQVCEGTSKKNDRQYYLDRKRQTGDMHGQAPVLWCATALLR